MYANLCQCTAVLLAAGLLVPLAAQGQNFRMETEIFVGKQKEPLAETLTLFSAGVVYDFLLSDSEEITIFDPQRGRFILLDPARRVKTTLTTEQLFKFTEALKKEAERGDRASWLQPQLEDHFDPATGWLTMSSKYVTYRAKGREPKYPEAVRRYQQFADWYARLNSTHPGNLPPFARIQLNKALAEKGHIPEEVQLTVLPRNRLTDKKFELRSRHLVIWKLSDTDRRRIEQAGNHLTGLEEVDFHSYRRPAEVASRDK